jgi:EAL domain-containing protein (putative c-di-GMP-specific phosphodiesterase class I)
VSLGVAEPEAGVRLHHAEADRLDSLASYGVLDSAPELAFDAITALTALLCDSPAAAVVLVDAERQWFKSKYGLSVVETPRATSICSDVVAAGAPIAVPDATKEDRYRRNPLVTGSPYIRAYLGVPLIGRDGLPLGALCVVDVAPRQFTQCHVTTLQGLADQVMVLLEQRRRDRADGLLSEDLLDDARDPVRLRHALDNGELVPYFQPLVDIHTGQPHQLEALLRWQHPELGPLPPLSFLPAVAAGALMVPVGRAVLDASLAQLAELRRNGVVLPGGVAVNVASNQLGRPGLARDVLGALHRHHLPGTQLTVEITEATALPDLALARNELEALTAIGVHVVMDDYGVGWSNLTRLLQLPIDGLKIDREIAAAVVNDPRAAAMVATTVAMANELGIEVTAEGIETEQVRDHLARAGCDWGQGWLYSPAVPADQLIPLLNRM